jgi:uncharacterized protein YegJ (DUF2314 family)
MVFKLDLVKISDNSENFWIIKLYETKTYIIGVVKNSLVEKKKYDYGDVIKYNKNTHKITLYKDKTLD